MNAFMKAEERRAFANAARSITCPKGDDLEYFTRKVRKFPSYWPTLILANRDLARRVAESMLFSGTTERLEED